MGVSVTAVHRLSSLDLCGISHSGGLVRTDVVGKEKAWIGRGLFSSLVLRPLRFPPVLTWLGFYNSPGRVTSRNSSPPPAVFFFTGRVGVVVTVEHLSSSQLERQDQSMIYGNICKMQSSGWCFQSWNRHCLTGDWKEKVLGGGLWSPRWYPRQRRRTWAWDFFKATPVGIGEKRDLIWRRRSAAFQHFCDV